jgi:D-3-phosphoglycerate dehydrogenase
MVQTFFETVITDSDFPDTKPEQEILGKVGSAVRKFQTLDANEVSKIAENADAILCDRAPINRAVISSLKKARVIVVSAVGYDNVDVKAAQEKGIIVCNVPDYMTCEVAEHTMALVLCLVRKITWADSFTKGAGWSKYGSRSWTQLMPISHLDGKTAGIIGFGRIGQQVAERLQSFKLKVTAFDPYVPKEMAMRKGVELVDLPTLMRESDIITVNCRLSEETYHLIGENQLSLMKENALIVNTARGKVIDQKALVDALGNHRIAGAGLDVLENEPCSPDDPLLQLQNVVITPHIGGVSEKSVTALRRLAAEEIARVLKGETPKHRVT